MYYHTGVRDAGDNRQNTGHFENVFVPPPLPPNLFGINLEKAQLYAWKRKLPSYPRGMRFALHPNDFVPCIVCQFRKYQS